MTPPRHTGESFSSDAHDNEAFDIVCNVPAVRGNRARDVRDVQRDGSRVGSELRAGDELRVDGGSRVGNVPDGERVPRVENIPGTQRVAHVPAEPHGQAGAFRVPAVPRVGGVPTSPRVPYIPTVMPDESTHLAAHERGQSGSGEQPAAAQPAAVAYERSARSQHWSESISSLQHETAHLRRLDSSMLPRIEVPAAGASLGVQEIAPGDVPTPPTPRMPQFSLVKGDASRQSASSKAVQQAVRTAADAQMRSSSAGATAHTSARLSAETSRTQTRNAGAASNRPHFAAVSAQGASFASQSQHTPSAQPSHARATAHTRATAHAPAHFASSSASDASRNGVSASLRSRGSASAHARNGSGVTSHNGSGVTSRNGVPTGSRSRTAANTPSRTNAASRSAASRNPRTDSAFASASASARSRLRPADTLSAARFIIAGSLAVLVLVTLISGVFAWNRWWRFDDAHDIQGEWMVNGTPVSVFFTNDKILLTNKLPYTYKLDPVAKTLTFSFGKFQGSGRYMFRHNRTQLVILDGATFSPVTTLRDDIDDMFHPEIMDDIISQKKSPVSVFIRPIHVPAPKE